VPAALALALGACAPATPPPRPEPAGSAGPSAAERERRRAFWQRYEEADALRRTGRWPEALPLYEAALEADPRHEDALYGLANCLLELGRHEAARDALSRLVAVNPLSQRAHLQLGYLHSCPEAACCFDLEAAQRELERAVAINREETGALLRLAEIVLARGDRERARDLLGRVRRANTHSVGAPWLLAWIALDEGRPDEARSLLEDAAARSRGPEMPTAVPAEGDTRGDHRLVASMLPAGRIVPPVWKGLADRLPEGLPSEEQARAELARLDASRLRAAAD
jgi:thioredoxin-like negative regulator of GroEL